MRLGTRPKTTAMLAAATTAAALTFALGGVAHASTESCRGYTKVGLYPDSIAMDPCLGLDNVGSQGFGNGLVHMSNPYNASITVTVELGYYDNGTWHVTTTGTGSGNGFFTVYTDGSDASWYSIGHGTSVRSWFKLGGTTYGYAESPIY